MSYSLGVKLTKQIKENLAEVNQLATERRAWWYSQNKKGVSQSQLAKEAGVVSHTVYTEIRKYRESKQCQKISQNI
jgi:transposase